MFRSESTEVRTSIYEDEDVVATIKHESGFVDLEISGCASDLIIFIGETAQRLVDEGIYD